MNLNKAFRQALLDFDPDDFSILSATQSPLDRPARIPTGFTDASSTWDKYKPVARRDVEDITTPSDTAMSRLGYQVIPGKGYGSISRFAPDGTTSTIKGILSGSSPSVVQQNPGVSKISELGLGVYPGMPQPVGVEGPLPSPVFASKKTFYPDHAISETTPFADGTFAVNAQSPETRVGGYYVASPRVAQNPRTATEYSTGDAPPVQALSSDNPYVDIIQRMDAGKAAHDEARVLYQKSDAFRKIYHHMKGGEPKGSYAQQTPPAATQEVAVEATSPWYRKPYAMYGGLGAGALGAGVIGYNMMSQPTEEEKLYSSPGYGAMPRSFAMG